MITRGVAKVTKNSSTCRLARTVSNKIDKDSFTQEYEDEFYPNLNVEEFEVMREQTGERLKGKATLKATELYSLRNTKSK